MATPLGKNRGSSLNLRWSKCGVWWVDQWVPISWLQSSWCHWMHARILYSFRTLICWLWWLICLDWGFWDNYFLFVSLLYLFRILAFWLYRLLILFCLAYRFWFLPWLFWSSCMYGFIVVYRLIWHVDFSSLYIILIVFEHVVYITIHPNYHSLYVDMSDIFYTLLNCMSHDCPLLCDCMSFVCVSRTSIPLPPTL